MVRKELSGNVCAEARHNRLESWQKQRGLRHPCNKKKFYFLKNWPIFQTSLGMLLMCRLSLAEMREEDRSWED